MTVRGHLVPPQQHCVIYSPALPAVRTTLCCHGTHNGTTGHGAAHSLRRRKKH